MGDVRTSISVVGPNLCVSLDAIRDAMSGYDYQELV